MQKIVVSICLFWVSVSWVTAQNASPRTNVVDIGSQRQLFVSRNLIDRLDGATLKLHPPQAKEIVLQFDQPWEGIYSGYETVLQDGDTYRLYYRGLPVARHSLETETTCVAESKDGIHWTKPDLQIYNVQGHATNNVVLAHNRGCHNLAPFIDTNPACPPAQRYKALGGTGAPGLLAFASADGIHWSQLQDQPVITEGAFDSQNNAFWSSSEQCYVCYFRVFREGKRWIARTTSQDFLHWETPQDLSVGQHPRQHLYTNQLTPYPRAPHVYLGFPTRYFPGRQVITADEANQIGTPDEWGYAKDCTDIQLISTTGGTQLDRTFMEAYLRPGLDLQNWTSRASYAARGIVQTSDTELSLYVKHHAGYRSIHVRRYTLRPDGFTSVNGPFAGGSLRTVPIQFQGRTLTVNYSTSAAGSIAVELQSVDGQPIPGYSRQDCDTLIGDRIQDVVHWQGKSDVSALADRPIRLCVYLSDADLFSYQFVE